MVDLASKHNFATPGDYQVVAALRRSHPNGLQPAELAQRLLITTAGITGRLDRLERDGLVQRRQHPSDRRALEIFVTETGIEVANLVFAERVAMESELLGKIPSAQRKQLTDLLRILLNELGEAHTTRPTER